MASSGPELAEYLTRVMAEDGWHMIPSTGDMDWPPKVIAYIEYLRARIAQANKR